MAKDKEVEIAPTGPMRGQGGVAVENAIRTASFDVSPENWKHRAVLAEVVHETLESKEAGSTEIYDVLKFVFRGHGYNPGNTDPHVPMFIHREWTILNPTDKGHSVEKQVGWQNSRIAQIYDTFMGDGANLKLHGGAGVGSQGDGSWKGFFQAVANDFNTAREGKPVFQTKDGQFIIVWMMLAFDTRGRLQIPFGNFIDIFKEGRNTLLRKEKNVFSPPVNPNRGGRAAAAASTGSYDAPTDLPDGF